MPEDLNAFNDERVPAHTPEDLHGKSAASQVVHTDGQPPFADGPSVETQESA